MGEDIQPLVTNTMKCDDLAKSDDQLVSSYTRGIEQQFQDSLNFIHPDNVSDAHQRALHLMKLLTARPVGVVGGNNGGISHINPTPPHRNVVPLTAQIRGQAKAQTNRTASTSAPPCCFKCSEPRHRMVDCRKGDRCGKGLFLV